MSDCEKCGVCCIVCSHIQLAKWEVDAYLYEMRLSTLDGELNGWSPWVLKRKPQFVPELNAVEMTCIYFDGASRSCTIYEKRPVVCQMFNCRDGLAPNIHKVWAEMKQAP